ncbi:MAG: hypothetical protein PHY34_02720 [Patescibacteria group bacterium]|nr:hypothetical protein [Patescibacteria group bacterium]MDD5715445.1 hypothetical protein [Patescibacteria group bacterium]
MTPEKPELETEVVTKVATSTKIALGIAIVAGVGAVIAITFGLFSS